MIKITDNLSSISALLQIKPNPLPNEEEAASVEYLLPEDKLDLSDRALSTLRQNGGQPTASVQTASHEEISVAGTVEPVSMDAKIEKFDVNQKSAVIPQVGNSEATTVEIQSAAAGIAAGNGGQLLQSNETDASTHTNQGKGLLATATLNSGAKVSIYTTDYDKTENRALAVAGLEKKVLVDIVRGDGSSQTLEINANTIISEAEDGSLLIHEGATRKQYGQAGAWEALDGTDGNDVIINLFGAGAITGGAGNDTILSFNSVGTLNAGEGNNKIFIKSAIENIIAGDGDNYIAVGDTLNGTNISVGNGNNEIKSSAPAVVSAGDGDNNIFVNTDSGGAVITAGNGKNTIKSTTSSSVFVGNGDNSINVIGTHSLVGELKVGDGNNTIKIDSVVQKEVNIGQGNNIISIGKDIVASSLFKNDSLMIEQDVTTELGSHKKDIFVADATFNFGDGNNSISMGVLYGEMHLGNGNNNITADETKLQSEIHTGNGDNSINIHEMRDVHIAVGNGNNKILSDTAISSEIQAGDGNNEIDINAMIATSISTGNGDNSFSLGDLAHSSISTSSGNDTVYVRGSVWTSNVSLGDGDNSFKVDGNVSDLFFTSGDGNDTIDIKGFINNSSIYSGNGSDNIAIYGFILNSSLFTGNEEGDRLALHGALINSLVNGAQGSSEISDAERQSLQAAVDQFLASDPVKRGQTTETVRFDHG